MTDHETTEPEPATATPDPSKEEVRPGAKMQAQAIDKANEALTLARVSAGEEILYMIAKCADDLHDLLVSADGHPEDCKACAAMRVIFESIREGTNGALRMEMIVISGDEPKH